MADQPDMTTIPGSFAALQQAFQPSRAAGADKTVQFNFTGDEPGTWWAHVHSGQFEYGQGEPQTPPNVTVNATSQDWLAVLRQELNPMTAVMSGRLKFQGDMMLMMQFQQWFAR